MVTASMNLSTEKMSELAMAKDNKYTMLYFPFHGVVTALRAIMFMSGAEYEFTHPVEWSKEKALTPLGAMPVLYEETKSGEVLELCELTPIEFYFGQKYGYTGSNLWEENLIRMYHSSSQSVFDKLVTTVVRAPKENYEQMMEIFLTKIVPEWIEYHERALVKNGSNGHYVGNKLSLADIKTATIIENFIAISEDRLLSREKTPAIFAVYDELEKEPKYQLWKASSEWKAYDELNKKLFSF
ncbi:hypothetical protein EMPS_00219 [Entomortierella parvispora]|uniref:Glutathione S-transferase n=1 Tax=Entomortierella parvispora TaxID=205924 RepID=A0A9P3H1B5_9FUNG|nr:hypothetical protein EMPS_00219 [Entomortierella parvispora]